MSDGSVRLEDVAERLDAGNVFPNCVPLQVEAPQASVELDPASKCGRPLALRKPR